MQLSPAEHTATGFFFSLCAFSTVLTLFVITVNRYIRVCHTRQYDTCCSRLGIALSITGVWVVSALFAAPLFPGWSEVQYTSGTLVAAAVCRTAFSVCMAKYSISLVLPLLVDMVLYVQIYIHFKQSGRRILAHMEGHSLTPSFPKDNKTAPLPEVTPTEAEDREIQEIGKSAEENAAIVQTETIERSSSTYSFLGSHLKKNVVCQADAGNQPQSQNLFCPLSSAQQIEWREEQARASISIALVIAAHVVSFLPALIAEALLMSGTYVPHEIHVFCTILWYADSFYNPIIYGARHVEIAAAYKQLWLDMKATCGGQ